LTTDEQVIDSKSDLFLHKNFDSRSSKITSSSYLNFKDYPHRTIQPLSSKRSNSRPKFVDLNSTLFLLEKMQLEKELRVQQEELSQAKSMINIHNRSMIDSGSKSQLQLLRIETDNLK